MKIKNITTKQIQDSNGKPTISTEITLEDGSTGIGTVPSGASTGKTEVLELKDEDGGMSKAIGNIEVIKNGISDKDFNTQEEFDTFLIQLDGTEQKSTLGGNTILSCSIAFAKAMAVSQKLELYEYIGKIHGNTQYTLPTPQILVMEGAKHGNWATDIQEYMLVPNMDVFKTFDKAFNAGTNVFRKIKEILEEKGYSTDIGFEGAYCPKEIQSNAEAFDIIVQSITDFGYTPGEDFTIAIDIASSEFFDEQKNMYILKREGKELTPEQWLELQIQWYEKYPISSIEDPFAQEDWTNWSRLNTEIGDRYQIVGDDLLTTNVSRIQQGIDTKAINSVLIKLNQIGTVTETLNAIKLTTANNMTCVISHRSGETLDTTISDLAVGTSSKYCKFGGPTKEERYVKYKRLLDIENKLLVR
ncbi:MAG: phosphopyruvate hydratase [Candidatus Dojkabacteria bacterium]|nr:phosphopyruvate hydratase [Candidatus Dojkabacteria bacterium]